MSSPMTIVIAPTVRQGEMYIRLAGIPVPWMVPSRPEQIRGVADGTRIIWLGSPDEYPRGFLGEITDMLSGRSSALEHDDLDRVSGVVRPDCMDEARIRFLMSQERTGPTREQADATFTAALEGDESAAATVREWAVAGHHTDDLAEVTVFTADMARSAMSDVRETARRPYIDYRDATRARPTPREAPSWAPGPDPVPVRSTPPPVPASGHYDEPDGWGVAPYISDEPTMDALRAGGADKGYTPLCRGERPVW